MSETRKDAKKSEVEALTADRDYWLRKAKSLEIAHDRLADEVEQRQDASVRRMKDGRVVCVTCGCVAVTTSNGRWICGGRCPN